MRLLVFVFMLSIFFFSCDGNKQKSRSEMLSAAKPNSEKHIDTLQSPDLNNRGSWQKPNLVIDKLGDLKGKTIADIGAGTGYFSFRLIRKADKVIAIDIDSMMLGFMKALRQDLPTELQNKIEIRKAELDNPKLNDNEVDIILIVNTTAYLQNRISYFKNLMPKLKSGGKLAIIDFKMKRMDINAPPFEERVLLHTLEEELYQLGFSNIITDDSSLEFQYFIFAEKG